MTPRTPRTYEIEKERFLYIAQVCGGGGRSGPNLDTTPSAMGWVWGGVLTQGSRCATTLGFGTKRRWRLGSGRELGDRPTADT